MTMRLISVVALSALLAVTLTAKDKHKAPLPEDVLRAETVRVIIAPDAGESLDEPRANSLARENVEKAFTEWGRFRVLVTDGGEVDLIVTVRTGNGSVARPTLKGGPIDQRRGTIETTDSTIHIGGQHGRPGNEPPPDPMDRSPHVGNEIGPSDDMFTVYRGNITDPLSAPPVWRYVAKDCLRTPKVSAVEEFRKALLEAEKLRKSKTP